MNGEIVSSFMKIVPLVLLLLVTRQVSPAQSSGQQPQNTPQVPLIRTTTRLVQLNVVVLDKQNHPVTDLTKEDFRVFDNGVEQQIAHFTGAVGDAPAEPATPSPLIINNRQTTGNNPPGVTAILMDEVALDLQVGLGSAYNPCSGRDPEDPCSAIRQMRLQVLQFLTKLPPGELIGIYAMRQQGVVVIHDFTDDSASLAAAARVLGGEGARGKVVDSVGPEGDRWLNAWRQNAPSTRRGQAGQAGENAQAGESPERMLKGGGLQALVMHMQGFPGRKNLVWISSLLPTQVEGLTTTGAPTGAYNIGTPQFIETQSYFNELKEFGRWLGNANVAVYPFDAKGLMGISLANPTGIDTSVSEYPQWVVADQIASESGGQALIGHNRLADDLQQIVSEGRQAYQMGYYPGDKAWDGKYHKIELKLTPEHKGLTLLCRKGYSAVDSQVGPSYESFRAAARGPVEAPGIGLTLNVPSNPIEWGPEEVVLKMNVHEIQFEQKGDLADANLTVAFVQVGKDGRILEGFTDDIALALQPETYADAEQQGWFYTRELIVSGMASKLRVVVRDRATGNTGTVSVPIHPFSMKNAR